MLQLLNLENRNKCKDETLYEKLKENGLKKWLKDYDSAILEHI